MAAPSKPPVIDAIEFARKGLEFHDTIALSQFSRLSDALASSEDKLDYKLIGYIGAEGKPGLRLSVQGDIQLTCQRCLEPLGFMMDIDSDFILVIDEGQIPSQDEEGDLKDYLVASPQMSIIDLLEDELLLALPFAPKHEECEDKTAMKMQTEKQSPFAVLKGLKTRDRD
ncbi:MAG TPA: YceD family protein [Methylophilaceae bacterium]|nr:YceD family protein [Methylophilaceae bacterium]